MPRPKIIQIDKKTAYLPGTKAAVTIASNVHISDAGHAPISVTDKSGNTRNVVKWGEENKFPSFILETCGKSPIVTAGLSFNINATYGDGVIYGRWKYDDNGRRNFVQDNSVTQINEFFNNNDIHNYIMEQANDLCWFYNIFPEILISRDLKIVELRHKEAAFSRLEEMNPDTGLIENHFYSAKWGDNPRAEDIDKTPMLSPHNTVLDLQIKMGIEANDKGRKQNPSNYRFVLPVNMPSPGRNYYQKPSWHSIIESGWLDYSQRIPEFKSALLENQMVIKYHVELSEDYFDNIFTSEEIKDTHLKHERIKKEYADLNRFLTTVKNTGKTVVSFIRYDAQGKELRRMKINVIENKLTGGEYIEDSEEASNIISYGLGVHPSLIGSSPGKNKNISGSEARELFIIKQAMLKPLRDRILRPLYIIRDFNKWPADIDFVIPNTTLKTLDAGTGSEKIIS